jgi:polyphosphate kinase
LQRMNENLTKIEENKTRKYALLVVTEELSMITSDSNLVEKVKLIYFSFTSCHQHVTLSFVVVFPLNKKQKLSQLLKQEKQVKSLLLSATGLMTST